MANRQDITFPLGATWPIFLTCREADGTVIALQTGDDVTLRIATTAAGPLLWEFKRSDNTLTVVDAPNGLVKISVAPQQQVGLTPRNLRHESRVVKADGTIVDQAFGVLTVEPSLYSL